jgi:hypothetical protein
MEFTWKDGNVNFLPDQGILAGTGPVEIAGVGDSLTMKGVGWTRKLTLKDATLTVEQQAGLPGNGIDGWKQGNRSLTVTKGAGKLEFTLQ